ncbi:MAG: hypothetical protein CO149_02135 [Nitrospirae bacterium CG_4_9_14_3_um_filter_51_5]|nr:MAG: hypothetical protein CO149_02135 [Nitrospirae bacterium CG_4_9_14_3_um_filter_51_5]
MSILKKTIFLPLILVASKNRILPFYMPVRQEQATLFIVTGKWIVVLCVFVVLSMLTQEEPHKLKRGTQSGMGDLRERKEGGECLD